MQFSPHMRDTLIYGTFISKSTDCKSRKQIKSQIRITLKSKSYFKMVCVQYLLTKEVLLLTLLIHFIEHSCSSNRQIKLLLFTFIEFAGRKLPSSNSPHGRPQHESSVSKYVFYYLFSFPRSHISHEDHVTCCDILQT